MRRWHLQCEVQKSAREFKVFSCVCSALSLVGESRQALLTTAVCNSTTDCLKSV